ncbi:MAG: HDIG domain-containing protein [Verrucomicrobiota bacterium]|nr:MAG: HDIG domain-containing protein [Verrucomicrobiota bacterium]
MFGGKKLGREKFSESIYRWRSRSSFRDIPRGLNWNESRRRVLFWIGILSIIVSVICFWGQDLIWVQFVPNKPACLQIVAEVPFSYPSRIRTDHLREQRRSLVAPVYRIDSKQYDNFENDILRLDELLDSFPTMKLLTEADRFEVRKFVRQFNEKHETNIGPMDVETIVSGVDEYARTGILLEGLAMVRDILYDGVFDTSLGDQKNDQYFLNIEIEGSAAHRRSRTQGDAIRFFQRRILSIDANPEVLQALFRLLRTGVQPNIMLDDSATTAKIARAVQETPPVIERVSPGDVLVRVGSTVTEEDYERLLQYRKAIKDSSASKRSGLSPMNANRNFWEHLGVTFAVLATMFFFLQAAQRRLKILTPKEIALIVTLLLANLLLCRLIVWSFEVSALDSFATSQLKAAAALEEKESWLLKVLSDPIHLLPTLLPITLSCLLGTLLLRTYVGILLGITTAIFACLMVTQSAEFLIMALVVVCVSIYFSRHSYTRTQIIASGNISGIVFAAVSLVLELGSNLPKEIIFLQMVLAFCNCFFIALLVSAILPIFEGIFKCCTNIRLIELTDYSNPLLSKLQILAPGTYHHSLMVANLSEQAAINIRANPFLCRTLALYHDIGKIAKPEYFTENQSNNKNPHDEKTPFMSALIIKSHVKEGVAIAKAAGLPPRIIDGIMEHHGTSVIRYFYTKALKQQEEIKAREGAVPEALPSIEIEKSAFKYDGPRPRSKETLILSIADSIEAASRSLYNPTPQSIKSLVNKIIDGKISESQFDECSVTFKEIDELRQAFYFTLLNMMHSRVSYDDVKV